MSEQQENQENSINPADVLAMVAEHGEPMKEAILDIPSQIYVLSRVTLAKSFIFKNGDEIEFRKDSFEKAWAFLSGESEENG